MSDEQYILQTFELARRAQGQTWPNPMVGAVIVKDGRVISTGFHKRAGTDHAELDAIKNAQESLEGATMYVNLEPCCHTNKSTPPCAQRLIQEKFKRVVISNIDPNPSVSGNGVKLLGDHGIEVETGILSDIGEKLNEVFFLSQRKKRPFIHLKLASTMDGKIAMPDGESQWITGELARAHVQIMRSHHQGIIVGAETVRKDNPRLTVRVPHYKGPQPYRIIFSRSGLLPEKAHLFNDEFKDRTLVYQDIQEGLTDLFNKKVISLMLEGGSTLASEFFKLGLVDRVSMFINPSFLGQGLSVLGDIGVQKLSQRPHLIDLETKAFGEDFLFTGRIK